MELSGEGERWKGIRLHLRGENILPDEYYTPETGTLQTLPLKNMPVVLALTGENVIVKEVREADEFTMLSRVMPISRQEEFFYRIDPAGDGYRRVVLARKADIEALLEALRPSGCFIVDVIPGVVAIERVVTLLEPENPVTPAFLPAYAAALSFFMEEDRSPFYRFFPRYKANSHAYHRKFRFLLAGGAIVMAGLFTANLALSRSWKGKLERYIERAGTSQGLLEEVDRVTAKSKEYAGYIAEKGLSEGSRHAFYCDRIACLTLDGMRFTRLEIEPPRKVKENEEIRYTENTILLSGVASSPVEVDRFMKDILDEKWVERIVHHDYSTGERGNLFHIEILLVPGHHDY
jgi:hypothetical protein